MTNGDTPTDQDEDRKKILAFLWQTYDFIEKELIPAIVDNQIPEEKDLCRQTRGAWAEFKENFAELCSREYSDRKPYNDLIRNADDDLLRRKGLSGAQLKLKLDIVDYFRRKKSSSSAFKWLKKMIDAIDALLDSILRALGIDSALKELKDGLATLIGD